MLLPIQFSSYIEKQLFLCVVLIASQKM